MSDERPRSHSKLADNALTTTDIVFMVLAVAAPMGVVASTMPLAFALGNGPGAPGVYLLAALALALFAVGYVRLLPHIPNAGAFYAIIAQSFGRMAGLGAAYVALTCYVALCCATTGALCFFAADLFTHLTGVRGDWGVAALVTIVTLAALSWFRIGLAAGVLVVALTLEVLAILVLDVAIIWQTGFHLDNLSGFAPALVFQPGMGIAAMYAFNSCIGFEGTAIYQEEARDPARSIPRATYVAIAMIGIFYVFTAVCISASAGADRVAEVARADPGHLVLNLATARLGDHAAEAFAILIVTSNFAAVLGLFNNSARYAFALARDGALPQRLAITRDGAPFAAGLPVLALLSIVVSGFYFAGLDPLLALATSLTGFGSVGLMVLLSLTAFGIPTFFAQRGGLSFATLVLPLVGGIMIAIGTYLSVANFSALTGMDDKVVNQLPLFLLPVAAFGVAQAYWFSRRNREIYEAIGTSRIG